LSWLLALATAVLRLFLRAVEGTLLTHTETAPAGARMDAVSFIHRFGAALNPHTHYHCCATDWMFSGDASGVRCHTSRLHTTDIQQVQDTVRQRTLRLLQRRGLRCAWTHECRKRRMRESGRPRRGRGDAAMVSRGRLFRKRLGAHRGRRPSWSGTEDDRVILASRPQSAGEDWKDESYPVGLDGTRCAFGGERAWFRCPASGCGRRVAIPYGGGICACRHRYQLAYPSQRERAYDRASRRAKTIQERLG
jgi:hypothetical protein